MTKIDDTVEISYSIKSYYFAFYQSKVFIVSVKSKSKQLGLGLHTH